MPSLDRRRLVTALAALPALLAGCARAATPPAAKRPLDEIRRDWARWLRAGAQVATGREPIQKPDAQWRAELTPLAYDVLRHEGTERPYTSPLNDEKRPGVFVCAGCALPLFSSEMKYDSRTGWPSFFTSIPDVFTTHRDMRLLVPRVEYRCVKCDGHHGHVFDDGPPPTGERYCNNGAALRFIAA